MVQKNTALHIPPSIFAMGQWVRNSHDDLYNYNIYEGNTEGDKAMSHPWRSRG